MCRNSLTSCRVNINQRICLSVSLTYRYTLFFFFGVEKKQCKFGQPIQHLVTMALNAIAPRILRTTRQLAVQNKRAMASLSYGMSDTRFLNSLLTGLFQVFQILRIYTYEQGHQWRENIRDRCLSTSQRDAFQRRIILLIVFNSCCFFIIV